MASRDDVIRILATCKQCGAVYAARQWPDGDIQAIGSDGCHCGSDTFACIQELGGDSSPSGTSAE